MASDRKMLKNRHASTSSLAVNRSAAAQMIGVSEALLRKQLTTRDPNGVPFARIGRRVVYRVDDLKAFLEKRVGHPDEMSLLPDRAEVRDLLVPTLLARSRSAGTMEEQVSRTEKVRV